ncbi:uncharacterized protein QC763_0106650 [Podospora pseudopauciseta]|uniref:Uncharacterized protein n=1 Tax=Podospora pseudopauciseta TaxID=2093780 RepID=A0ABR0H1N0_9PEZI|nr:hypothetical protein QC763_0106650 [Podospora pseudopauciseta]
MAQQGTGTADILLLHGLTTKTRGPSTRAKRVLCVQLLHLAGNLDPDRSDGAVVKRLKEVKEGAGILHNRRPAASHFSICLQRGVRWGL